jgi:thiamine pyrophosphate-dependent acetolactate synthase large subunit-like protein
MVRTIADQFAEVLATAGVKRVYGIVGDSLNGLTDSLRRQGKIEWIHVRHEDAEILFKECSHYCELVSGADEMPRTLEIAIREAVGKRSVSVVVMPGDVAKAILSGRGDEVIDLARTNLWR